MRRIRLGWQTLRENKRSGVALVAALCASALLLGLALSLVYSSGVLLARSNRKLRRERCDQLARSLGTSLDAQLRAYTTDRTDVGAPAAAVAPSESFYAYVSQFLDREEYAQYDPDNPTTTTYYYAADEDYGDDYGKLTIRLRKENPDEAEETADGEFDFDASSASVTALESAQFIRYQLQIGAAVELDGESDTYYTDYYRKDSYSVNYTWVGEKSGEQTVYWYEGSWYRESSHDTPMERKMIEPEDGTGEPKPEEVTIRYHYDTNSITQKVYQTTYESQNRHQSGGDGNG